MTDKERDMNVLHVSLFGGMKVTRDSEQGSIKLSRTSQLILAYLLLGRQRVHSREILSELFWGEADQSRARHCLNTAIWRLRREIETESGKQGAYLLVTDTGEIGFNPASSFWLDVAIFEECVHRIRAKSYQMVKPDEVQELETKTQLYIGELLEGIYTDWAIRAREYERMLYLDGLKYLMGYYAQHNVPLRALEFGQKILDLDPLREDVHREMMRLYMSLGQRSFAIRQYEFCCQNLNTELGIVPLEETQILYAQIIAQPISTHLSTQINTLAEEVPELHEIFTYLQQAARNIEIAQEQFQKALHQLQNIILEKR
jgi:DNA-binding SARP family transcriptional activator